MELIHNLFSFLIMQTGRMGTAQSDKRQAAYALPTSRRAL